MNAAVVIATCFCGGIGAICRGFLTEKLSGVLPQGFPWPTLLINIVASTLIGWVALQPFAAGVVTAICVGFLGGFSSMSTLNYEAVSLFTERHYARCFAYLVVSFASCILGCALGVYLA
ncbi:MAG: CrcB family protein [Coriobacteriia bacterium]|nr:CrcB family protein [Coriobacteriia bacterium]